MSYCYSTSSHEVVGEGPLFNTPLHPEWVGESWDYYCYFLFVALLVMVRGHAGSRMGYLSGFGADDYGKGSGWYERLVCSVA